MTLSIKARGDVFALSRRKQADARTAAVLTGSALEGMLVHTDEASTINVLQDRRDNQDQKTGFAEATAIDILTQRSEGTITVPRAAPDPLAWMAAFFCNHSSMMTVAGTVRLHTSRISTYAEEPPYFTSVHRKGGAGGSPAMVERVIGNALNTFRFSLTKGEFVACSADVQGLGFRAVGDRGIFRERKTVDFATLFTATLTYDVEGAPDDAVAKTNIQAWVDADDDGFYETELSIVDYVSATDIVTVSDPTLTGPLSVEFVYPVKASVTGHYGSPSWRADAEALVIQPEFKLRAGSMQIRVNSHIMDPGPTDDLIAFRAGSGQIAGCEIDSLEYTGDWQGEIGYCWRAGASEELNATQVTRGDLRQTIRVNRRVRDWLFAQRFDDNDFLSIAVDAIGPNIGPSAPDNIPYLFKAWFPRCKFLNKPYRVDAGRWIEEGEILVLAPQPGWGAPTPAVTPLLNSAVFQVRNAINNGGNGYL